MKFSQETSSNINQIRRYQPGEVTVQALFESEGADNVARIEVLKRSFIITGDSLDTEWAPQSLDELSAEHFSSLAKQQPEVVLLGAGELFRFPKPEVMRLLMEANIGYEVMDSGAACRTYNILAGDGRKVAAAILLG